MEHIANEAESLNRRPGVWMQLGRSHVERPKDTNREIIKREKDVKVKDSVGDRAEHTTSVISHSSIPMAYILTLGFKTPTLSKKLATRSRFAKT